jgi:hypothetical protein
MASFFIGFPSFLSNVDSRSFLGGHLLEEQKFIDTITAIKNEVKKHLSNKSEEYIKQVERVVEQGIPTPVLTICGKGTQEIRFTKYLTYFLDKHNHHGLNYNVLKYAFEPEAKRMGLPKDWYMDCEIFSEYYLGTIEGYSIHNYIDILIKGNGFVIGVEQKLLSGESNTDVIDIGQLDRYSLALKQNQEFKNLKQVKIYLTPNSVLPSSVNDWSPLSHENLVTRILPLLDEKEISVNAKENLKRLLLDWILGPYDKTESLLNRIALLKQQIQKEDYPVHKTLELIKLVEQNHLFFKVVLGGS